jgi:hypothetical protein
MGQEQNSEYIIWFAPPEVKTSGFRKDKPTKGAVKPTERFGLSPFSGLGSLAAGGFNLWRHNQAIMRSDVVSAN